MCYEGIHAVLVLPRWSVTLRTAEFLHTSLLILSLGRGTAGHSYTAAGCLFALLPTGEVESCSYLLFITYALVTFLTGSTKHSAVKHFGSCLREAVPHNWKGVAQAWSSGHFTSVVQEAERRQEVGGAIKIPKSFHRELLPLVRFTPPKGPTTF